MKQLTDEEIARIFDFTKSRYVEWYEVQVELVDHLAHGIEDQWEDKPDLPFEDALQIEFKKFGVFGFSELVEQKANALNTYYIKQIFFYVKYYFKPPKIIAILFAIWLLYIVFSRIDNKLYITVPIVLIVCIIHIRFLIVQKIKISARFKLTGKKWLFENDIIQLGSLIHFLSLGIYIPHLFNPNYLWSNISEIVFSICTIFFILVYYISFIVVPIALKREIIKQYPEYKTI